MLLVFTSRPLKPAKAQSRSKRAATPLQLLLLLLLLLLLPPLLLQLLLLLRVQPML